MQMTAVRERVLATCCLLMSRKMSGNTQSVMAPVRLGPVSTPSGQANEVLSVQPSLGRAGHPPPVLVFFGGDVQDYPEVMEAHRDHKQYVEWSLTSTATILASKFPAHHVLVVKPSRMERKTYSCYDNFVSSDSVGAPSHQPGMCALTYLASLIPEALNRAQAQEQSLENRGCHSDQYSEGKNFGGSSQPYSKSPYNLENSLSQQCATEHCKTNSHWSKKEKFEELNCEFSDITFIGFSKGCVVLNQIITELHFVLNVDLAEAKLPRGFISKVSSIYWLDGGHAGGSNTWITSPSVLKSLATLQRISIHIHVTPYQVYDESRPWIGKECKAFYDTLRRSGAKVSYCLHFREESASLVSHFRILNHFT